MALDTTVGGASADSYVTVAETTTYVNASTQDGTTWAAVLVAGTEEPLLRAAALRLNQVAYMGRKAAETQRLAFPREGLRDEDGYAVGSGVVPDRVKRAQMKLAVDMARGGAAFLHDTGLEGFRRAKVGPLEVEPRASRSAGALPADVRRELAPFATGSGYNFRVVRGG